MWRRMLGVAAYFDRDQRYMDACDYYDEQAFEELDQRMRV